MISFVGFPVQDFAYGTTRHHPDIQDDLYVDVEDTGVTCPGEYITSSHAYMRWAARYDPATFSEGLLCRRGHGTYVEDEEVIASVAGTIDRVNKLVTVRAIRTRSA